MCALVSRCGDVCCTVNKFPGATEITRRARQLWSPSAMASIVCPGERLGSIGPLKAGAGTYEWQGAIHSSLTGVRRENDGVVSVAASDRDALIPGVGDVVLARITKVNPRFATAKLLTGARRLPV